VRSVLVTLTFAAATCPAAADANVTFEQQRIIRSYFQQSLVNPDTAQWSFDLVRSDPRGTLICGRVDYMNSAKIYVGARRFYIILRPGAKASAGPEERVGFFSSQNVDSGDIYDSVSDDPGGGLKRRIEALCRAR